MSSTYKALFCCPSRAVLIAVSTWIIIPSPLPAKGGTDLRVTSLRCWSGGRVGSLNALVNSTNQRRIWENYEALRHTNQFDDIENLTGTFRKKNQLVSLGYCPACAIAITLHESQRPSRERLSKDRISLAMFRHFFAQLLILLLQTNWNDFSGSCYLSIARHG